ncbi:hypothetical protein L6Q79_16200, partial [bacterium]|nr:hypothetical protein [bacterium]
LRRGVRIENFDRYPTPQHRRYRQRYERSCLVMKRFIYILVIFCAGCFYLPITSSRVDSLWGRTKYIPQTTYQEQRFESNMNGYFGEILILQSDGKFSIYDWHHDPRIGNFTQKGKYESFSDTLEFVFDTENVNNNFGLVSSHEVSKFTLLWKQYENKVFLVAPAQKYLFCESIIHGRSLLYQTDSSVVGKGWLLKIE